MSTLSKLSESYVAGANDVRKAIAGMSKEQLNARPVPGRWSTHEVVCHLADSEQAWAHRIKRIIAEEKPLLIGYDESRFAATLAYDGRDIEEELNLFDATRRQIGTILKALPESALQRSGIHSERGTLTLEKALELEIEHVAHHIRFVSEKRKALGLLA
jgi:uncharacterized damage-inducible protein DinB